MKERNQDGENQHIRSNLQQNPAAGEPAILKITDSEDMKISSCFLCFSVAFFSINAKQWEKNQERWKICCRKEWKRLQTPCLCTEISHQKHRAGLTAERKQKLSLAAGKLSVPNQNCCPYGSHRVAAAPSKNRHSDRWRKE